MLLGVPQGCSIQKSKPRAGQWGSRDHLPLTSAGWTGPIYLLAGHLFLCLWFMYVCVGGVQSLVHAHVCMEAKD